MVASGEHGSPEHDPPVACSLRGDRPVDLTGREEIPDGSQFELVDSPVHGSRRVESAESEVEQQIQSVLDVFSLLFSLLSADKLNLSCVFDLAY